MYCGWKIPTIKFYRTGQRRSKCKNGFFMCLWSPGIISWEIREYHSSENGTKDYSGPSRL